MSSVMNLILESEDGAIFMTAKIPEIGKVLLYLTKKIDLKRFKKHKSGAKKPPPPKNEHKGKPHVSTVKLLS